LFPAQNCLVVDAGTCITYNILAAEGAFMGGNIAPGLTMRLKAMHHFTAKLPLVERDTEGVSKADFEQNWMGKNTENAMRIGAKMGILVEMEGFYRRFLEKMGNLQLVITGGDGQFLSDQTTVENVHFEPNLVFKGLNRILNKTVGTVR
jgi:type III pantothenate kinase